MLYQPGSFNLGYRPDTVPSAMNPFSIARYMLPMTRYPYEGARVPCPVCGETGFTAVASVDRRLKRLPTVMCERCGLLYTNPMPSEAELSRYYRDYYRFDYQLVATAPTRRHVAKRRREAEARAAQVADLLPAGARTLDFGAGSGEFVALMLEKGFDAHGFEPGGTYSGHAMGQLGQRIRPVSWQEAEYDRGFDLITCFHVLEHLSTPLAAIERMVGWLAPGGWIYLEVPEMEGTLARKGFGGLHFAHVLGFNHDNLRLAAARAGLKAAKVVEPTGIVFERGDVGQQEQAELAAAGRRRMEAVRAAGSPGAAYLTHHLGKAGRLIGRKG